MGAFILVGVVMNILGFLKINNYAFIFFLASVFCYNSVIASGMLVYIDGTSSSGKSTVSRLLIDELNKDSIKPFEHRSDDNFDNYEYKKSKGLLTDDEESEASTVVEDDNEDDDPLDEYLYYLKDLVHEGNNVVGEVAIRDKDDMRIFKRILGNKQRKVIEHFYLAMVFCPLKEIVRRVEKRNRSGDKDEKRSIYQAVWQFAHMFKVTKCKTKKTIDSYTKKDLEKILKSLKQELIVENKKKHKKDEKKDDIADILTTMRKALSPKKGRVAYLEPRFAHDLVVVNKGNNGAQQIAKIICSAVKQHSPSFFKKVAASRPVAAFV
ncbi:MAG: hypothetical protein US69_C0007G0018 [candidate division TM6 bacterium GW2011_GWF2_38_10]|nr:MAG: hypothetical protein US69_C0007G0018 [candidate division TM6 bacterium GW2011_GWF2_38_10]